VAEILEVNEGDPLEAKRRPAVAAPHHVGGSVHRGMVALLRVELAWLVDVLVRKKILPAGLHIELLPTEMWPLDDEDRVRELRPDVVARLWSEPMPARVSLEVIRELDAMGLKVEVQLRKDERKRERWREMVLASRSVLGRQIIKVVLTFDRKVAQWALQILRPTRSHQKIIVLTPGEIPCFERVDPREQPHRALLGAMMHGKKDRSLVLLADALRALRALEPEEIVIYRSMLLSHMGEALIMAAHGQLEAYGTENWDDYEPDREERESFLYVRGRRAGKVEGREEGREEGEAIGRARFLVDLLRQRGLEPSAELEATVLACRDPLCLQRWLVRALTIDRADELLQPD
jgi:hypothetical protein